MARGRRASCLEPLGRFPGRSAKTGPPCRCSPARLLLRRARRWRWQSPGRQVVSRGTWQAALTLVLLKPLARNTQKSATKVANTAMTAMLERAVFRGLCTSTPSSSGASDMLPDSRMVFSWPAGLLLVLFFWAYSLLLVLLWGLRRWLLFLFKLPLLLWPCR